MRIVLIQVVLVVPKGQLVTRLETAVLVWFLLDGVVRQVDQLVAQIVVDEDSRRCPQISVIVRVALQLVVGECEHAEAADIELALVVERGPLDVLLHDEGPLLVIVALAQDAFDFLEGGTDGDAIAAISIFTGLDNPNIARNYFLLILLNDALFTIVAASGAWLII